MPDTAAFACKPQGAGLPPEQVGSAVLFENERVRVWEMVLGPGETCSPHRHRNDFLLLYPDAAVMRSHSRSALEHVSPGLVAYYAVGGDGIGPHQMTNAGAGPARHYIIELLCPPAAAAAQLPVHNGRVRHGAEPDGAAR